MIRPPPKTGSREPIYKCNKDTERYFVMSEDLIKEEIFEALEFQWLHKPEPPYEARTIEEVTDKLKKVLPDIPVETIKKEAEYWLDCYTKGII